MAINTFIQILLEKAEIHGLIAINANELTLTDIKVY